MLAMAPMTTTVAAKMTARTAPMTAAAMVARAPKNSATVFWDGAAAIRSMRLQDLASGAERRNRRSNVGSTPESVNRSAIVTIVTRSGRRQFFALAGDAM